MIINEARTLLEEIDKKHPMMEVRLVLGVKEEDAHELVEYIKGLGCQVNLQSSAFGDIEAVITEVPDGDIGSSWS